MKYYPHGHVRRYHQGCGCEECRAEIARYERHRVYEKEHGRPRMIPSLPTLRQVQALAVMGWPLTALSERIGWHKRSLHNLYYDMDRGRPLHRSTAEKITALYDELCMIPGPSTITRKRALAKGWRGPLDWDDIANDPEPVKTITDRTIVDEVVVERILAGEWSLTANCAERTEVTRRWIDMGRSRTSLERASRWNVSFYMARAGIR